MNPKLRNLLVGSGLAPVLIPRKEFEAEHKRLLKVLKSKNPRLLRKEYQTQKKELEGGLTERETGNIFGEFEKIYARVSNGEDPYDRLVELLAKIRRGLVRDGQFRGEVKRHFTDAERKLGRRPLTTKRLDDIWLSLDSFWRLPPIEKWGGSLDRDSIRDLVDARTDFETDGSDYTITTFLEAFDSVNDEGDLDDLLSLRDDIETRGFLYDESQEDKDYILRRMNEILEEAERRRFEQNEDEDEDVENIPPNIRPETPTTVTGFLDGFGRLLRGCGLL